jgi:hypothetical protein
MVAFSLRVAAWPLLLARHGQDFVVSRLDFIERQNITHSGQICSNGPRAALFIA